MVSKFFGPTKFVGSKKNFGPKIFGFYQNFELRNKFCDYKYFVTEKNFWSEKILDLKKLFGSKNFESKKFGVLLVLVLLVAGYSDP